MYFSCVDFHDKTKLEFIFLFWVQCTITFKHKYNKYNKSQAHVDVMNL